jgi:UDP-N-acetylmuramate--alanine ligase
MRIHFIGIGGVGVSALAEVALSRGIEVSGSDRSPNAITERLEARGARIFPGHYPEVIADVKPDLVVYSTAVSETNPEMLAVRAAAIPALTRSQFLGQLMEQSRAPKVAIAGTHGKTTTTCMVGMALVNAGLDPTVLVGGDFAPFHGNVRLGGGPFVTEACEAFRSFLDLHPDIAVITNVESDHLDCYGDFEGVLGGFRAFVAGMHSGGALVLWSDDPHAGALMEEARAHGLRVLGYGLGDAGNRTLCADNLAETGSGMRARIRLASGEDATDASAHWEDVGALQLGVPGRHNVLNALAALGAAMACGADPEVALAGLQGFGGVERRFQVLGERDGVTVVDDYAHHPTEIAATIAAARGAYPGRRIIAVFQPHLYSRTRDLLDEFAEALASADAVVVAGIYAAREEPIPGVSPSLLTGRIAARAPRITLLTEPDKRLIPAAVERIARPADVLLVLGAGDIREVAEGYLAMGDKAEGGRT